MKRGPEDEIESGGKIKQTIWSRAYNSIWTRAYNWLVGAHPAQTPPADGSSPIATAHFDVLTIIMNHASVGKTVTPALGAVNHRFREAYNRVLNNRLKISENDIKNQQNEINYLLENKKQIIEGTSTFGKPCADTCNRFEQLEASIKKNMLNMNDAVAFQVREEILDRINANIIRPNIIKMRDYNRIPVPGGFKTQFCSETSYLSPYITRFPSSLFTDPTLRDYWSTLVYFKLVSRKITALPPEIGQLAELATLNLRGNQLTAIPAEICELKALEWLCLDNNQLENLPDNLNEEILKTVDNDFHTGGPTTKVQTLSTQKVEKEPDAKRRRRQ